MKLFTVCCLFYGDYPRLVERLLQSLNRPAWFNKFDLRIVWNALSRPAEKALIANIEPFKRTASRPDGPLVWCCKGEPPYYKYPAMRKMFHGRKTSEAIKTPYVMWFDDDSWVRSSAPDNWFDNIAQVLQTVSVCGKRYYIYLQGNQREYIVTQPWYNHKPIANPVHFVTGGWWAIHTRILHKHNWPPADFHHNGGDVMLGVLCHQHGYRMKDYYPHVAVNADESGRASSAPRRGASLKPIGVDFALK